MSDSGMSPSDSYWRIKDLFTEATELPFGDRAAFIERVCGADTELFEKLSALLSTHDCAVARSSIKASQVAQSTDLAMIPDPLVGTKVGSYSLLEIVGEGGMGVVYKAEQQAPIKRVVALKLIKLGMDTRQVIARFETERQTLALMNHPNVATVHDAGASDTGRPYFVMEYVPGTPITTFCDTHKYTTSQRLELFMQACEAIQHAHQKTIIHRDIKPANILVSIEGDKPVVKVIDFGVAKATGQAMAEQTLFTQTGQLVGTPEYMSPEQAGLNVVDIDTRTDIYSLGVVLYELLVGALPFESKTLRNAAYAKIQQIIRETDPPRPSTRLSSMSGEDLTKIAARHGTQPTALARELRAELEWIPMKAMRKEPAHRYRTAAEFAEDIRNYLQQKPLIAAPESSAYRLRKLVVRNKGPVFASLAVVAALIAGIIGTTIGLVGQSRQRVIAEQQRAEAEKQEAESEKLASLAVSVSQFQTEMFSAARPNELGEKVTVVETMAVALKKLDAGRLKDQPVAEANIREMIGRTLHELGRHQDAEPILRKAIELRRRGLSGSHWGTARAMHALAITLQELGKLEEAESGMREALALARQATEKGDLDIAGMLAELGFLLEKRAKYPEAEAVSREALQIQRAKSPPNELAIAYNLSKLAWLLQVMGKFPEAESFSRESLALRRKNLPPGAPDIAESLNVLAVTLARSNRLAEAEPFFREMLEIDRKSLPSTHPRIGQDLNNLASVLQEQGQLAEAEPLQREGLELRRQSLPAGHPYIAQSMKNLAALLARQGKFSEAEPMAREALSMRRAAFPAGHPDIASSVQSLASILSDQGKMAEAEPLYLEAIAGAESLRGKSSWEAASARLRFGTALTAAKRFADAEAVLIEAERVLAGADGAPSGRHNEAIEALVELFTRWEESDPSAAHDQKAKTWASELARKAKATTQPGQR